MEEGLALQIRIAGVQVPEREFRFCAHHVGLGKGVKTRLREAGLSDWRLDFAWPDLWLGVEVDGGQWIGGGHNTGVGSDRDFQKGHHAARLGWLVYRCNGDLVKSGQAMQFIQEELVRRQDLMKLLTGQQ